MAGQPLQPLDENWEKALAVVAHPDDLEYGAASAIAKWTSEGKTVIYVLVTRGEAGINNMNPEEPERSAPKRRSTALPWLASVSSSFSTTRTASSSMGYPCAVI